MLPRNAKGNFSVGTTESCPWQLAIAHAKELETGRRYRVPSAYMHQRGRSSWPLFSSRSPGSRTSTPTRSMHAPSPLVPWHVPNFANDMRGSIRPFGLPPTTAIAARLRDAKSESIRKTRAATCRVLGDLHAAPKLRKKDSVPSICAATLCGTNPTTERATPCKSITPLNCC
jgi:hypothetical protein